MKISDKSVFLLKTVIVSNFEGDQEIFRKELEEAINRLRRLASELNSSPAMMAVALGALVYLNSKKDGMQAALTEEAAEQYSNFVRAGYELAGSDLAEIREEKISRKDSRLN